VKVGLVILFAIAVLALGVFLIGDRNNLFKRKNHYYTEFNSAGGLKPGNPVQLNGVDVGTIDKIILPKNPTHEHIQVWLTIDRAYAERIRGPRRPGEGGESPPSKARIKTLGLLGDKFIEISFGAPEYPVIPPDSLIPAAEPTNVDALVASGEDVMDNVVEISHSLSMILGRLERGEGFLGEMISDSEASRRLKSSLLASADSLQRVATRIETGEGPLPRLLNDRKMADRLASSLDRFEAILAQAQNGPGLVPGLLNDPSTKAKFDDTLANLNQVARDLHGFTADLDKSEGLLPRLVNDKAYGREITGKVQSIVDHLDDVSAKLSEGNGTAAKLINDPKIYDAVNDIIVGVNDSKVLRWLIRNRQKKGIEKRYDATKGIMESRGKTPPPLDGPGNASNPPETPEPPPLLRAPLPPPAGPTEPPAPPPADSVSPIAPVTQVSPITQTSQTTQTQPTAPPQRGT
jgi:phospholipid/cholesterol/gamma-HCH transport system substrate-binding protein